MKSLLLPLLLLLCSNIFAQGPIYFDADWNETDLENAEYYRHVTPLDTHFLIEDYYMSGQLQAKGVSSTASDPLVYQGEMTWYHGNGNISEQGTFENGIPNGVMSTYYADGTLRSRGTYVNGVVEGIFTEYFTTGDIGNEANFSKGLIHGTHINYQEPNVLGFKIDFVHGKVHGTYEIYGKKGMLLHQGTARDNRQDGQCFDYYYDSGKLRRSFNVLEGYFHGTYKEYDHDGKVITIGEFDHGKPLKYQSTNLPLTNNSLFKSSMKLKGDVEHWQIYRDGKLILKSFYRNGQQFGTWKAYIANGKKLYQTIVFSNTADCTDDYLQSIPQEFKAYASLSARFDIGGKLIETDHCSGTIVEYHTADENLHPFYHYKITRGDDQQLFELIEEPRFDTIDYKEPANSESFLQKNTCVQDTKDSELIVCEKVINGITYKAFLSENLELLQASHESAKPLDNEIYFYYQKFEERVYIVTLEDRPQRYMGFKLPEALIRAINDESFDVVEVIRVYEHEFWNVRDFSGFAAYRALERAMPE
jgi:antitoxin component YwqK of YwqJK toxin-antitoxin module